MIKTVDIYVDGAAEPNPGHGSYGAILIADGVTKELCGYIGDNITNNAAELTAAIKSLECLKWPCDVTLYSDSQYLINTMTKGWARKANQPLWRELDALAGKHKINWQWIRGHNGHQWNERAHDLCREVLDRHL